MGRKIAIRKEHIEEILMLSDNMRPAPGTKYSSILSRYKFWSRLEELYPETVTGEWSLNTEQATTPFLMEEPTDDIKTH